MPALVEPLDHVAGTGQLTGDEAGVQHRGSVPAPANTGDRAHLELLVGVAIDILVPQDLELAAALGARPAPGMHH